MWILLIPTEIGPAKAVSAELHKALPPLCSPGIDCSGRPEAHGHRLRSPASGRCLRCQTSTGPWIPHLQPPRQIPPALQTCMQISVSGSPAGDSPVTCMATWRAFLRLSLFWTDFFRLAACTDRGALKPDMPGLAVEFLSTCTTEVHHQPQTTAFHPAFHHSLRRPRAL